MAEQLSQECSNSEEDVSERVIGITCNTVMLRPICRLLQRFELQYFYQSVSCRREVLEFCRCRKLLGNNVEEAHKYWHEVKAQVTIDPVFVISIICNTTPGPNRRLLQLFGLQYYFRRVSCGGEVLIKEFCNSRELLGNNVEKAHKHWRVVVAHDGINPVIKACALSFSVISTPETTEYLQKHWNDLCLQMVDDRRAMVRGNPDYQMSRFMVQYALAWAMRSQDLDTALLKVKTCYDDMKKANLDNFFLAPYYTVTIGRWIFEANEHNLSNDVIKEVLQYAAETFRLIATLEEDWARNDVFGAKISALNLFLLVANYLYRQPLHFTDDFKYLYPKIKDLHEEIRQELNQNHSRVVLYDQAWFHSVSATYYQLASITVTPGEETDRMYAFSQRSLAQAARLYDINGRWWRSHEEAKRADNPDLIREYAKHGRSAPPIQCERASTIELVNCTTDS